MSKQYPLLWLEPAPGDAPETSFQRLSRQAHEFYDQIEAKPSSEGRQPQEELLS